MLVELLPGAHARYASLSVVGRHLEGLLAWLRAEGHSNLALQRRVRAARRFDELLRRHHVCDIGTLTASDLLAYLPTNSQKDFSLAAAIRSFVQYFERQGLLAPAPPTAAQVLMGEYGTWLQRDRGLAVHTVQHHAGTIREFLDCVGYERDPNRLHTLGRDDLEHFIQRLAARRSRASLQHVVAQLRAFLQWLAGRGRVSTGLAEQVDTPRVYRGERVPRALPRETMLGFLNAIDRATTIGRRDDAMFLLIATYGLRTSEVVALA